MKFRIYAKKTVLMEQLHRKGLDLQENLSMAADRLDALEKSNLFVEQGTRRGAETLLDVAQAELDDHEDLVALVASHDPPEVMVEFED